MVNKVNSCNNHNVTFGNDDRILCCSHVVNLWYLCNVASYAHSSIVVLCAIFIYITSLALSL